MTPDEKPRCRHCGTTAGLPLTATGNVSSVCVYCRRNQVNARRGTTYRAEYRPTRLASIVSTKPLADARHVEPRTRTDRAEAIKRAQERARREGLPLAKALELEGIL